METPRVPARFVVSAVGAKQLPTDGRPEIALAGRSNVGKSSLVNRLVGHGKLARTSRTPGRTQTLNIYDIAPTTRSGDRSFYLVDMPGYGYAEVSRSTREQWGRLIKGYLETRETLRAVVLLIDIRHPPQPLDLAMVGLLREADRPYLVVATKADVVGRSRVAGQLQRAASLLQIDSRMLMAFSAETGHGRDALWQRIQELTRLPAPSRPEEGSLSGIGAALAEEGEA